VAITNNLLNTHFLYSMSKLRQAFVLGLLATSLVSMSSCATVFGGPVSTEAGQPQRDVRVGALVADILLFWPGTIVDFATGAIYKPQGK
jgi:hypothetical protein